MLDSHRKATLTYTQPVANRFLPTPLNWGLEWPSGSWRRASSWWLFPAVLAPSLA